MLRTGYLKKKENRHEFLLLYTNLFIDVNDVWHLTVKMQHFHDLTGVFLQTKMHMVSNNLSEQPVNK